MPSKSNSGQELTPFATVAVSQILHHTAAFSTAAERFHAHGQLKKATYERIAAKIEAAERAIREAVKAWEND